MRSSASSNDGRHSPVGSGTLPRPSPLTPIGVPPNGTMNATTRLAGSLQLGVLPILEGAAGGAHQYSLAVLEALHDRALGGSPPVVFALDPAHPSAQMLRESGWDVRPVYVSRRDRARAFLIRVAPRWT